MDETNAAGCIYCGLPFGVVVEYGGSNVELKRVVDHMVPWSYTQNHASKNLVYACQICNGIKADKVFDRLEDARDYVQAKAAGRVGVPSMPPEVSAETEGPEVLQSAVPLGILGFRKPSKKARKCNRCGNWFEPLRPGQILCFDPCRPRGYVR